jgi:hypothetical protein
MCACFIEWQKAFDCVKWNRLMQILKETGFNLRVRRLIRKLYMNEGVKVRLHQGQRRSVKIGRGARQVCCLSPILSNLYSEYLTNESLGGSEVLKRKEEVILAVKYAMILCCWLKKKGCYRAWLIV